MRIKQIFLYLAISVLAFASCTPEEQPPTVSYLFSDVSVDAGQTSATITCRNESVDDNKLYARVLLSKNENIVDVTKYSLHLQNDTLRSTITGLESNTLYYFCFEVYTANEHKRTDEVHHFQTTGGSSGAVMVTTSEAINVTQTTATSGGSVTADSNFTVSMRGVCWDTVPNPNALQSPHLVSGQGTGTFLVNITDLVPGTTYHMKAYALCNDMVYYGNEVLFTTQSLQLPTVTTNEVTNITQTTAQGGGNVTNSGNSTVNARGVCWSTSHNPTTNGSHTTDGTGTGSFTSSMTGLVADTTYYVRAYATNSVGTAYGSEVTFTISQNVTLPTVTTSQITHITQTTAVGGGNVSSDGGATVTERGICWSTSHNPTTASSHATSGTGMGDYTLNMTGLTENTTYYVRAYATNSAGTAYGSEVSFTTGQNLITPTVTTSQVTNITQTTATGGGNVTNSGSATVTARGVCWSTSHNPTTSNSHTTNGTGTGSFTSSMTGLTANKTYYVRAYATNSAGTAYGAEVSFTTSQNVTMPTVTTSQVMNITQTTATGGGYVTNSGNATVTARGICWSTSHNPTTSNSHTTNGTGTGSFTSSMTGLTANTTYYVRAYATNSAGTAYGSEVSFVTLYGGNVPTGAINGLFSVSATKQVFFSQGNLQYKASTNTWRFATNQYDYVDDNNSNISQTYSGWIDLFGWGTSGWNSGNDYYHPWNSNNSDGSLYGPPGQHNLTGSYANADWGVYNPISNGGNTANQWRTLTRPEWNYVFNTRSTISGIRYAKANVADVDGVILLPDNWNASTYSLNNTNSSDAEFSSNTLYDSQWGTLEQAGAVFLPAAGLREGTLVGFGYGCYWSASYSYSYGACSVGFDDSDLGTNYGNYRYYGFSVRLVRDAGN